MGLRVEEYLGNGLKMSRGSELYMAAIDEDNTSVCMLSHDGTELGLVKEVYVQCAVLYTTPEGQRRVRVHNLALGVTVQIADVFRSADVDAISNVMVRNAVAQMKRGDGAVKVHTRLNVRTVEILCSYRKFCAKNPTGQQVRTRQS